VLFAGGAILAVPGFVAAWRIIDPRVDPEGACIP